MRVTGKPRRKRDGSYELPVQCPACGGAKMEVNLDRRVYRCWLCHLGGSVPPEWELPVSSYLGRRETTTNERDQAPVAEEGLSLKMPLLAQQEIQRRGFEEAWVVHRYGVRWDGERLCWPAGAGWSRRSVLPWIAPKALTVRPRGLVGQHLLRPGARLVLCEGDWKAAAIPLPWVGLGLLGTDMTPEQAWSIRTSNPASVAVLLDGGYEDAAAEVVRQLLPLEARVLTGLPFHKGPDDIPRAALVRLLLQGGA